MVRVNKVRDESLGDVEDERVEILLPRGTSGGATLWWRGHGSSLCLEAQVEEVGYQERQEQASGQPQQERRPELAGDENEEIGCFNREVGGMKCRDRRHGRHVLERDKGGRQAVELNAQDQGLDHGDAAQETSERVGAFSQP